MQTISQSSKTLNVNASTVMDLRDVAQTSARIPAVTVAMEGDLIQLIARTVVTDCSGCTVEHVTKREHHDEKCAGTQCSRWNDDIWEVDVLTISVYSVRVLANETGSLYAHDLLVVSTWLRSVFCVIVLYLPFASKTDHVAKSALGTDVTHWTKRFSLRAGLIKEVSVTSEWVDEERHTTDELVLTSRSLIYPCRRMQSDIVD